MDPELESMIRELTLKIRGANNRIDFLIAELIDRGIFDCYLGPTACERNEKRKEKLK